MNKTIFTKILIGLMLMAVSANASKWLSPKSADFQADTVYNDDLFLSGSNIKFDSKVRGDLFAFCYEIVQTDSIEQSFNGWAYSIQNLGAIGGSFRGFAYTITSNAPIGRNLLVFCRSLTVGPRCEIGQNADISCDEFLFQGVIHGTTKIHARTAIISGTIMGDLQFDGDTLTINPSSLILGNITNRSINQVIISPGAVIKGDINWEKAEAEEAYQKHHKDGEGIFGGFGQVVKWLVSLKGYLLFNILISTIVLVFATIPFPPVLSLIFMWIMLAVSGNILIILGRKIATDAENSIVKRPFPSLGLGFVIMLLAPMISTVLLFTFIGAPLGIMLIMLFGVASFAGLIYACIFIGRKICSIFSPNSSYTPGNLCYTIGMFVVIGLMFLPYLGYLIALLVIMIGLGGLAMSIWERKDKSQIVSS